MSGVSARARGRARLRATPLPHPLRRWWGDPTVRRALLLAVLLRVVLGVAALLVVVLRGDGGAVGNHLDLIATRGDPLWPVVAPWERFDTLWLAHIAGSGYTAGSPDAAFYPLVPLLMRLGGLAVGDSVLAGLLIDTAALAGALVLLHRLVAADFDERVARRSVLAIALFPAAFFLVAPYTEAVFLLLVVGAFTAMRGRRFVTAGVLIALAALCRPTGVTLLAPLLVELALLWRERRRRGGRFPYRDAMVAMALPLGAMAGWFLYARSVLGLPEGPVSAEAQRWGQTLAWPWQVVADSLAAIVQGHHVEEVLNLAAALGVVACLALMVRRRFPWSYVAYVAACLPLLFLREARFTPMQSDFRFIVVLFPLFVLAGTRRSRPRLDTALAVASVLLMVVVLDRQVEFAYVG